ncbi:MAG TPA: hypothetical protein VGV35_10870, partial [Bryobacteraceae bacterium]|nr:hypothetical protein [Bryobacteraceae bacterium]
MALFRVCGVVIESSVPLPELPGASSDTPECCFEILPAGAGYSGDFRWLHHRRFADEDEDPWLSISRLGTDYLLRFPTQADFLVSCDGKQVRCRPLPETPESTVRHLFLDQVMPLLLSRREPLVLHASAVLTKNGAVAFAGLSGQGKSTLAAALARGGNPLLCDDC